MSAAKNKKGNWSAQELHRLKDLFPRCPPDRVAKLMGRSVQSVRRRAIELFERAAKRGAWSDEEEDQLRVSFGILALEDISLVLARSERDVAAQVEKLRRRSHRGAWTRRERTMLKKLYGSRSDAALEVCLSRPRAHICEMAAELCLSKDKRYVAKADGGDGKSVRMPRWTAAEVKRLEAMYPEYDNLDIAQALARSVASVANKASQLGLSKSKGTLRDMGRRNVAARYEEPSYDDPGSEDPAVTTQR